MCCPLWSMRMWQSVRRGRPSSFHGCCWRWLRSSMKLTAVRMRPPARTCWIQAVGMRWAQAVEMSRSYGALAVCPSSR